MHSANVHGHIFRDKICFSLDASFDFIALFSSFRSEIFVKCNKLMCVFAPNMIVAGGLHASRLKGMVIRTAV